MQTAFEHNTNTFGQTDESVFTMKVILYRENEEVLLYSGGFSNPHALMGKDKKLKEPFDFDGVNMTTPNFHLCENKDIMTGKVAFLRLRDDVEQLEFHILDKPVTNSNGQKSVHPQWNKTHNGKEAVINTNEVAECHMTVNRGDELKVAYTTKMLKVVWNITSQPPKEDSRDASPEPEFEEEMSPAPEFQEPEPEKVKVKKEQVDLTNSDDEDQTPAVKPKEPKESSSNDKDQTPAVKSKQPKQSSSDEDDIPLKSKKKSGGSTPRKAIPTTKKSKSKKDDKKADTSTPVFEYKLGQAKPNQPMSQYIAFITDPTQKEIVKDMVDYCKKKVVDPKSQRSFSASMNSLMQTRVGTFIKDHNLDYTAKIDAHNSKIVNITEETDDKVGQADPKEKEEETTQADLKGKGAADEKDETKTDKVDLKEKGPADKKLKKRKRLQVQSDNEDEDEVEMVDVHTFKLDKTRNYTTSSVTVKEKDLKGYALKGDQIMQDT
jgi:hypothetical protein